MAEMPPLPGLCQPIFTKLSTSPVVLLHRAWFDPKLKKIDRADFDMQKYEVLLQEFLDEVTRLPCVNILNRRRSTECVCLFSISIGNELQDKVIDALKNFALLKKEDQHKMFIEWILYAAASCRALNGMPRDIRRKTFILPGTVGTMVCKNAISRLLGFGKTALENVIHYAKSGITPRHALCKRFSNAASKIDFKTMLDTFFDELSTHSAPRATRLVATIVNGIATK
jgi:hypothetical protein